MNDTLVLPDVSTPLTPDAAERAFATIMDGEADDESIARFLTGLADRGETGAEIAAAAAVLRARMLPVGCPQGAIDVCGTGGDGAHTLNISTAVALVVAACGVPVAKHGNRAASSRSGAADVLAALGIDIDAPVATVERALHEIGIAFLFANNHHKAMARVGHIRRALGRRTIFNLLGPLINPACVRRQLVGVPGPAWVGTVAEALRTLGSERAIVVNGSDGLDELTVTGPTTYAMLVDGRITQGSVSPEDAGLGRHDKASITGGSPEENAEALRALLQGAIGGYRDIVLLNAAAALIVADRAPDWRAGAALAAEAIDRGHARDLLERWTRFK